MAYGALTLAGLAFAVCGKSLIGGLLYGLAIVMNAQAVFVLPVFLILWFFKKMDTKGIGAIAVLAAAGAVLGENLEKILFGFGVFLIIGLVCVFSLFAYIVISTSDFNPEALKTKEQSIVSAVCHRPHYGALLLWRRQNISVYGEDLGGEVGGKCC
jgi:hypothetical protein